MSPNRRNSAVSLLGAVWMVMSAIAHGQSARIAPIAVSDSSHMGDSVPANTLDGDYTTRWTSQGLGQYIQYDFGTPRTLSQVKLAWEKLRDYTFDILVSTNGTSFSRVGARRTSSATSLGLESFDAAATGRYLRIVGYGYTGQTYISITEAQFYGSGASSPSVSLLKWHPGHYAWPAGPTEDTPTNRATRLKFVDSIGLEPAVQGIELITFWGALEGDTPGDYSKGFAMIDAYLSELESQPLPKRLMIGVQDRMFSGPNGDMRMYYPSYVINNGWVDTRPPDSTLSPGLYSTAMSWRPEVMDRLIALTKAYAARYNKHPLVEMFSLSETSLNSPSGTGQFSVSAYSDQLKRWCAAAKAAWPNTQMRLVANFLGDGASMRDLIVTCAAGGGMAVGGPDPELPLPLPDGVEDIAPSLMQRSNQIFRGLDGGQDLRGIVPWVGEQQDLGLGLRYTFTPLDILTYQTHVMDASYMIWMNNTYIGSDAERWRTGILPLLQTTTIKLRTACPTAYQNRCDGR